MIDKTGREICPCIFDFISFLTTHTAGVKFNMRWGVIGYNGDYILPCVYDAIHIDNTMIIATKLNMIYTFNLSGEYIGVQALPNV